MIQDAKLDFWTEHSFNVLFKGKHGVGKTSIIINAFNRAKLQWRYFSAATMDPWVDFIGVPRATQINGQDVLELIRPKEFADDEVEAIFFDEFNRAPKKVRNAVMELIQFKSINGRVFKNLKIIWAAINPDDEDRYDVERLDDAQVDRFHIHVDVPYKCNKAFFVQKYGEDQAEAAIEWWNGLPDSEKERVSPRRLDYALTVALAGGNLRDVLPKSSNISKLSATLQIGPVGSVIRSLMRMGDDAGTRKFLSSENNYTAAIPFIIRNRDRMRFCLPLISAEKLSALLIRNKKILNLVIEYGKSVPLFAQVITDIYHINKNKNLLARIEKTCENIPPDELPDSLKPLSKITSGVIPPRYGTRHKSLNISWTVHLGDIRGWGLDNTHDRKRILRDIEKFIPPSLTTDEALATLTILDEIARRSYAETLKRIASFIPLVNHCCHQLEQHHPQIPAQKLYKKFNKNLRSIVKRLRQLGKEEQFWFPI